MKRRLLTGRASAHEIEVAVVH